LFDTECPPSKGEIDAITAFASKKNAEIHWSNPSFEVWVLSHFCRPGTPFGSCDALIQALNVHWKKEYGTAYDKCDKQLFGRLRERLLEAVTNCEWVNEHHHCSALHICEKNSSTTVSKLVKLLLRVHPA
jgi:hypothetical protein